MSLSNRFFFVPVLLATVIIAALFGTPLYHTNAGDGALVVRGSYCRINPDQSKPQQPLETFKSVAVLTPSGNAVVKCMFDVPAELIPAERHVVRGFECGTLAGPTWNTRLLVTQEGKGFMTCRINGSSR